MTEFIKPSLQKIWAKCPYCSAKTILYDNTANCNGIFIKCSRGCKKEFELIIEDGQQMNI